MREPPLPRDPWSNGGEYGDAGDALVRFENPRAELVAVRRELLARLVTVLSRRLASSTRTARSVPPSYRSDRRTDPIVKPRDASADSGNSARFDISTAGPRFAQWRASLLGLALIALGLVLPGPLIKFGLWTVGAVVLIHSVIRALRGK
jgi:hypothetical protein